MVRDAHRSQFVVMRTGWPASRPSLRSCEKRNVINVRELELTDAEKKYLDEMMNKVSRSFAIVVLNLEKPLNCYMAAAYLICRVVDNIEDCNQPFAWKWQRFQQFHRLID